MTSLRPRPLRSRREENWVETDTLMAFARSACFSALWSAPGSWGVPMSEIMRESIPAMRAFRGTLPRALRTQLFIESKHPKEPTHWYLGYLGVAPTQQGRGLGAAMLHAVLDEADKTGTPAYLESSNERNLSLYERHGFKVVEAMKLLGKGPTVWRMWRDPA